MKRQRGVALIAALLAVALAVVLVAALLDHGETARGRTAHALRGEQSWQMLRGVEAWALRALRDEDAANPGVDSHADLWARPLPPVEVPGGRIGGRLRELGGCFNVNALWSASGGDNALAQQRFQRLLQALRLDPGIEAAASDWIDADIDPRSGGAEDLQYRIASPAYRAGNRPMVHVSELRLVRGMDAEVYATLAPHVCALPDDHKINLNTATPELWMSLDARIGEAAARRLWREGRANYRDTEAVKGELKQLGIEGVILEGTGVATTYFVVEAEILADGLPFLFSSLVRRADDGGSSGVLARQRGAW